MTAIYPIAALQHNPKELRERAANDIVHITENGSAAYVFCSEETFAEYVRREREDAVFEARLGEAIGRGLADIRTGNFYTDIDEALEHADELRLSGSRVTTVSIPSNTPLSALRGRRGISSIRLS
ncbi:MAG: hypothetical protein LBL86_12320 [Coriobacteriales bacterium]|jgi:hypothetical protein|nr:hypothetical protein [Coriobacteriales bacterium]